MVAISSTRAPPTRLTGLARFADFDRGRTVVWLEGEHDIASLAELTETLAKAVSADDSDVIVDLHAVTFLSVATLDVLIRLRSHLAEQSRTLSLRAPSSPARRLLQFYEAAGNAEPSLHCT
jgi:anti-anti-sigma factor